MPDPVADDPIDKAGENHPEGLSHEPTDSPPPSPEAQPEEPRAQEDKVHKVKHSDFRRIKDEARARGRREVIFELDSAAQSVGFASYGDALKALAELKTKPAAPPPAPTPQPDGDPTMPTKQMKNDPHPTRDDADDRAKLRKQWRAEERRRRELQQQLDAKEAEIALRDELYRKGVHDVDYALRLLTRELEGKTEEEIAAYNRDEFYEGLRKDRPYLFGEKVAPATTGTNGTKPDGTQPAAPAPGAPSVEQAAANQFDARTAKPADVQARLRALGLNPHM